MNKYHNKKTLRDGIMFDSKAEADYYTILKLEEKNGLIKNLRRQVPFEIMPAYVNCDGKKIRAIKYLADFVFERGDEQVIVDVKGVQTPEFKLKWKLLGFCFPNYTLKIVKV